MREIAQLPDHVGAPHVDCIRHRGLNVRFSDRSDGQSLSAIAQMLTKTSRPVDDKTPSRPDLRLIYWATRLEVCWLSGLCRMVQHRDSWIMSRSIIYVDLDVHRDMITVALVQADVRGEVRQRRKTLKTPAASKTLTMNCLCGKRSAFLLRGAFNGNSSADHCTVAAPSLIVRNTSGSRLSSERRAMAVSRRHEINSNKLN
jgi:hypothetical protein